MIGRPKLVLASGSPRRLALLNQAGIEPDSLQPAEVDEIPIKGELPRSLATRLARAKAQTALASVRISEELRGSYILAADTVVAVGRRIMPKAEMLEDAAACLRLLSGRNHRVYTGVCLVTPKEAFRQRLVETRVRFKRLSTQDLEAYLASGEWRGKAGGYALQGYGEVYVRHIAGSYSNVVGLPLAETRVLLKSAGYPIA
jgi:septum formation protein